MRHASPLRYPGGKACLTNFLTRVIERNNLRGVSYFEPYAGGAGAALSLLRDGVVSSVFINDADARVSAFWESVVNDSDRFVERVFNVPLTMTEWYKQREICAAPGSHDRFAVGFSTFFMNRCNRSGVLIKAGPIGGYKQAGKWKLNVRFNREPLAERILALARLKDQINVSCLDAIEFLKKKLPKSVGRNRVFVYLDPPYVHKGQRLYLNAYEEHDHIDLARYLERQEILPWIMSYDDTELVRGLYADQQLKMMPIQYTLHEKRVAKELIIAPHRIDLPTFGVMHTQEFLFEEA